MTQQYHEHLLEAGQKPTGTGGHLWPWLRWVGALVLALLALLALPLALSDALGSPSPVPLKFLYISFHGDGSAVTPLPQYGMNQILRFDLELPEKGFPVLDATGSPTPPRMLRDMQVLKDGTLFIAQGLKFDSCILQYGPCTQTGARHCLKTISKQFPKLGRCPIVSRSADSQG